MGARFLAFRERKAGQGRARKEGVRGSWLGWLGLGGLVGWFGILSLQDARAGRGRQGRGVWLSRRVVVCAACVDGRQP